MAYMRQNKHDSHQITTHIRYLHDQGLLHRVTPRLPKPQILFAWLRTILDQHQRPTNAAMLSYCNAGQGILLCHRAAHQGAESL